MGCAKKKMAKGGMVAKKRPAMRYAVGGAIAPPMSADEQERARFFAPDPNMYRNDAKNMANVQAYIKDQGVDLAGGKPTAADVLGKFQAGQFGTEQPQGVQPPQPGPATQAVQAPTTAPRAAGLSSSMNLDNSLGFSDLSAPQSGLSGVSLPGISTGLGQDPSRPGMFRQGGAIADYRMGGPVSGGPPGVDTVPARLNNGEYVLPVQTTQAFGGKPALDQAVLATTGKPPVGYEQGGMPVRSTYDQLRMRGQDLNAAVDRMTGPPAAPQGFAVPQQSAQARVRPAPRQSEGRLGGGMPGMERQYGKGGQIEPGNIDLTKRPMVRNPDGSISTVRTMGIEADGRNINIPTVSPDGRIMSNREAIGLYDEFGKHLGVYDSRESAATGARQLHEDQERMYGRGYADGGQFSGWNTDRAAQIENAVNGAMGQPAPVAPPPAAPPAAPEMQLSQGEQYALDSARAAEATQAPKPSKFETLLRAMTGKPAGYAKGGEVQGYRWGGQPGDEPMMSGYGPRPPVRPPEDVLTKGPSASFGIRPNAQQDAMLRQQEWEFYPKVQGTVGTVTAEPDRSLALPFWQNDRAAVEYARVHPTVGSGVAPNVAMEKEAAQRMGMPTPPRGPQRQQGAEQYRAGIRAMDQQPGTQDIPVSILNEGQGAPVSKTAGPIDMRQANANFRQNVAAIPEGGTMRQYGNTKIYMTRDPKTGQPIFSNISAEAATPAGFETIKAQGKLGGSPFGDPETNRKLTADILDQRNELRFSRGEPPVGGWPTWGAEQQQRKAEREAGIEAGKDATKIGLTGQARLIVDQANAETAAKNDWGKNATAGLDKLFADQGMDGVNTRLEAAYQTAADPALQQRFKTPQQQQAFAIGVAGRMPTWTEALELTDQDPVAARSLIAIRRQEIVTQMLAEATSAR